jgi:ankyrin repeat protein
MDAVLYKHEGAVRLLLARGARTAIQNNWRQTAFALAEADGLDAIARLIAARQASDANQVRSLSLIAAVKAGDRAEVERLISAGVDIEERAPIVGSLDDDYTPLAIACREGSADIVRLLLAAGADPGSPIGLMRGTSLHEASYFGHAHIVRTLTSETGIARAPKPDLSAQGPYNGLTALHDAVWHGHVEAARALIESGAPLDVKTHAGQTPRELAILHGYDQLAQILAEAEAHELTRGRLLQRTSLAIQNRDPNSSGDGHAR